MFYQDRSHNTDLRANEEEKMSITLVRMRYPKAFYSPSQKDRSRGKKKERVINQRHLLSSKCVSVHIAFASYVTVVVREDDSV